MEKYDEAADDLMENYDEVRDIKWRIMVKPRLI